jgi:DNA (cytosine-5)-methyltransferase 1
MIRFIDLFAGIGGFRLGIERASKNLQIPVKCVFSSEIEKNAVKIYEKNFKETPSGDITKVRASDIPDIDLLCGGFPCQDVSIAGKREGLKGKRTGLFFEIVRIAREKQPEIIFLENVRGLLTSNKGWDFARVIVELENIGYEVEAELLNSRDFNIPQNRERVYIIGHLREGRTRKIFPLKRSTGQIAQSVKTQTAIRYPIKYGRRNQRVIYGDYSYALDVMGTGGVYEFGRGVRHLTPIERERLQGFPDNWTWTESMTDNARMKMLGNTVTVPVIESIAQNILNLWS